MKLKLKLKYNDITLSLDCVEKKKKYIYIYIYIYVRVCMVFSHKLWYMLVGTEFIFLFHIRRVLGGASRLYL